MKNAFAVIVCVILIGIGVGSFSGVFAAFGLNGLEYSNLLPGGLGGAFILLTTIGAVLWFWGRGKRDGD